MLQSMGSQRVRHNLATEQQIHASKQFIASLYSCIDIIILRPERKFQHHLDGLSESLKQEISDSNFIV